MGLEIIPSNDEFCLTQFKYNSNLLPCARLINSKIMDTPVELNVCLTLFNEGPLSNPTIYRQLVGNLVYLIVTYPDISYVVHQVS